MGIVQRCVRVGFLLLRWLVASGNAKSEPPPSMDFSPFGPCFAVHLTSLFLLTLLQNPPVLASPRRSHAPNPKP
uniref:Secreted protein n=1 Tax=Leersia perrieri TaxID=77586 RepID=A0A0D9WSM4_9ORYZ